MRYGVSTIGDKQVLYASPYNNDVWVMSNRFEYVFDESNNSLLVVSVYDKNKETVLAITSDGKVVIRIPIIRDQANRAYISRDRARFIMNFCSIVFGYKVLILNRFRKNRVYVYPDTEGWINWDTDPIVKKYVIDANATAVILDLNMNVLYGASPQKNPSNKRDANQGPPKPRCKKESDW